MWGTFLLRGQAADLLLPARAWSAVFAPLAALGQLPQRGSRANESAPSLLDATTSTTPQVLLRRPCSDPSPPSQYSLIFNRHSPFRFSLFAQAPHEQPASRSHSHSSSLTIFLQSAPPTAFFSTSTTILMSESSTRAPPSLPHSTLSPSPVVAALLRAAEESNIPLVMPLADESWKQKLPSLRGTYDGSDASILSTTIAALFPGISADTAVGCKVLCSDRGRDAILRAMETEMGTAAVIDCVPVDARWAARTVFERNIRTIQSRKLGQFAGSSAGKGKGHRLPLLCNASFAGTGKSTLQQLNMFWFKQEVGGIPIEVTFNDDQVEGKFPVPTTLHEMEAFPGKVALRILYRALVYQLGNKEALNVLGGMKRKGELLSLLGQDPIPPALAAARELVGAPPDTNVLLCVDEIVKAANHDNGVASGYLSILCEVLDNLPNFYLSVSAYGAVAVEKFSTGSRRPIALQPLPPIFPITGLERSKLGLLPPVLQVFVDETLRVHLPREKADRVLYARLSRVILDSGGHPRRASRLLHALSLWNPPLTSTPGNTFDGKKFVDFLKEQLHIVATHGPKENAAMSEEPEASLRKLMDDEWNFNVPDKSETFWNSIARDAARGFLFPQSSEEAKVHEDTLYGTTAGLCQYLPNTIDGHAFLPSPLLEHLAFKLNPTPGSLSEALCLLGKALFRCKYVEESVEEEERMDEVLGKYGGAIYDGDLLLKNSRGKPFEHLAAASLLLYARAHSSFRVGTLCAFKGKLCRMAEVKGGDGFVDYWDDVHQFPPDTEKKRKRGKHLTSHTLEELVAKLRPSSHGAIFIPTKENNPCGDVYGLFRVQRGQLRPGESQDGESLALVVLQCKDWFDDPMHLGAKTVSESRTQKMVKKWRESQKLLHPSHDLSSGAPLRFKVKGAVVDVVFLLFSANPLDADVVAGEAPAMSRSRQTGPCERDSDSVTITLAPNEGVLDLLSMRQWLPTAAYSAELAHRVSRMFSVGKSEEGNRVVVRKH